MGSRRERHSKIQVAGFEVNVVRKGVKNLNLSVRPPDGHIRLAMPHRVTNTEAREFISSRLDWIRRQRQSIADSVPPRTRSHNDGDVARVWGVDHTVRSVAAINRRGAFRDGGDLVLALRSGDGSAQRIALVDGFLRKELHRVLPDLVTTWEPVIGVNVAELRFRKMKTRWGSCNIERRRIWLNLELATREVESLESVLVHEMVHLVERRHNARFYELMDQYLPDWRHRRALLNASPPHVSVT